jgi:F-type H+-transporting ATPase subunit a
MSAEHETLSLGDKINASLSIRTAFTLHIGPLAIPVTETVVVMWGVMAVLIVFAFFAGRGMKERPGKFQCVVEAGVDFLNNFAKDNLGKNWWAFAPYLGTVALFILVCSIAGIFSPVEAFGTEPPFFIKPPTRDLNVTAALAIMTIVLVLISNIRFKGFVGFLKSFLHPTPIMLPFNIMEYAIKPLSLALRLFGNILGSFIIMELITISVPIIAPPIVSLYFDLFDGLIQTVVFVLLTAIYLSEAAGSHEEHEIKEERHGS